MKICPVCKSRCFDDMEVCYGCMYNFNKQNFIKQPIGYNNIKNDTVIPEYFEVEEFPIIEEINPAYLNNSALDIQSRENKIEFNKIKNKKNDLDISILEDVQKPMKKRGAHEKSANDKSANEKNINDNMIHKKRSYDSNSNHIVLQDKRNLSKPKDKNIVLNIEIPMKYLKSSLVA